MKTFTMADDEAQQAILQIGAQAIADAEQARAAIGRGLQDDQRKQAELQARVFREWQASVGAAGQRLFEKNHQALAATRALALALVRKLAAELAKEN